MQVSRTRVTELVGRGVSVTAGPSAVMGLVMGVTHTHTP